MTGPAGAGPASQIAVQQEARHTQTPGFPASVLA